MVISRITAGLAGLATCTAALAQGSFNFDSIPGIDQQPIVAVDVNPVMIGFFRTMAAAADPEAPDLFAGLRSIKLRVYHSSEAGREFSSFIQGVAGQLEGQGWQRVASVQGEGSNVQFHMQMTEEMVTGMTIMVLDGEEAIFMNIDGSISAADLGRLMAQYDIPGVMEAIGPMSMPTNPPPPGNDGN
jgi:hypothetical protein